MLGASEIPPQDPERLCRSLPLDMLHGKIVSESDTSGVRGAPTPMECVAPIGDVRSTATAV